MQRAAWVAAILLLTVVTCSWAADGGPVAYWRLDSRGPQVPDLSGNGHVATVTGGEVVEEGGKRFLRLD